MTISNPTAYAATASGKSVFLFESMLAPSFCSLAPKPNGGKGDEAALLLGGGNAGT
jgi:hypothetical protein